MECGFWLFLEIFSFRDGFTLLGWFSLGRGGAYNAPYLVVTVCEAHQRIYTKKMSWVKGWPGNAI